MKAAKDDRSRKSAADARVSYREGTAYFPRGPCFKQAQPFSHDGPTNDAPPHRKSLRFPEKPKRNISRRVGQIVSDREWAHTTYGYMGSILLAVLVPDRYQEMIARGPEYDNDSIILGSHYAMDVLGGRTL